MAQLHSDWTGHNVLLHTIMVSAYLKLASLIFSKFVIRNSFRAPVFNITKMSKRKLFSAIRCLQKSDNLQRD